MTRDDIMRMAREAGFKDHGNPELWDYMVAADEVIEHFFRLAYEAGAAAERKAWPNLDPVITWLENGFDPKEAAKELRIYAASMRFHT